mgnify:FL=1
MKKTIFKLLGTGLIAASVFIFVSCGDSTEYDAKSDTIYSLDAPRVTAKAYPGVNYISWEPVTSAQGYKIYRVLDGDSSKLRSVASDVTCYADIAASDHILSDGKVYKYIVEAVSKSDPASREVYAKNSQGSASVTAIVPKAGSPAISAEPASASGKDYIKKYYEKLVTKAAENVTISIKNGNFYAEYPATAGFKYEISASFKGKYDALGEAFDFRSKIFENYKEDYKAEFNNGPVPGSSEYEIRLKVSSVSDLYEPVVLLLGSLSAESIGELDAIENVKAEYIASKTALVSWTPATLKNGKDSPVANFKVYRTSDVDDTWTAVSAEVKEGQETDNVTGGTAKISEGYYITDTVEDDSISYTYYVVHTDGKLFGKYSESDNSAKLSKVTLTKTVDPTLTVSTFIESTAGIENTIKITSTKGNEKQTLALSYVKLAEDADGDAVEYISSDFTALELANNDGYADSYINYIKDAPAGTYLVKLTASEKGKKENSVYKTVIVSPAEALGSTLTVSSDGTKVTVKEAIKQDSKVDSVGNYKYTLYKVVSIANKDYSDSVSVVTTKIDEVALAYPTGVTNYCEKEIPDTKSTESNVTTLYYVVKARASDPSVFVKVSN